MDLDLNQAEQFYDVKEDAVDGDEEREGERVTRGKNMKRRKAKVNGFKTDIQRLWNK